jgi:hypothetical protein
VAEKGFALELIDELKNALINIKKIYPMYVSQTDKLIHTIDFYQKDNIPTFPEILKSLDVYIDGLAEITPEDAHPVSESVKRCCRECMFHLDDCFVNSIYLIFKSIELGEHLKPNKIRPSLRMDSAQKIFQKFLQNKPKEMDPGPN